MKFIHPYKRESGSNPEQYPLLYSSKQPWFYNATVPLEWEGQSGRTESENLPKFFHAFGRKSDMNDYPIQDPESGIFSWLPSFINQLIIN